MRCKTSTAQHLPPDIQIRTSIFLRHLEELRADQEFDPDCIINMDETPVYFDMVPGKTIAGKGDREVVVRTTGAQKRHITVVLTVSSSADALPPLVIFKGKRFPKDISKVPDNIFVEMHPNGWMTQEIMETWISKVLKPHTRRRPTLLVMDSFKAHTADLVNRELWKASATPAIIPGGCTSKIQPLDVSINKPFKDSLRKRWVAYLNDLVDKRGNTGQTASRQLLLNWIRDAWTDISMNTDMIKKSFSSTGILGAIDRAAEEERRHCQQIVRVFNSEDEDSNSFPGFSQQDLPYEPSGYDSDPFQLADSDTD